MTISSLVKSSALIAICVTLSACQMTSMQDHVWVTDLAAKDVVKGKFPLQGRVRIGDISRLVDSAPANTERAIELSFRSNGFLASKPSDAEFRLDATILEVAESLSQRSVEIQKPAENLKISDQAVIVLNQYFLKQISSEKIVREMTVLTVYDPENFDDGILINCATCNKANMPSAQLNLNANSTQRLANGSKSKDEAPSGSSVNSSYYRPVSKEAQLAGAIATILMIGILSGGTMIPQFYGLNSSAGSSSSGT